MKPAMSELLGSSYPFKGFPWNELTMPKIPPARANTRNLTKASIRSLEKSHHANSDKATTGANEVKISIIATATFRAIRLAAAWVYSRKNGGFATAYLTSYTVPCKLTPWLNESGEDARCGTANACAVCAGTWA